MKKLKFPKPSADLAAYNETLERGFERFPGRYENYKKFKNSKTSIEPNYLPVKLDIENVSRCNLSCDMCQVSTFKSKKRASDLSFDDFKRIIDDQVGVFELKLQGLGEPFLQDDFIEMVKYASAKDIWVRTTTNATVIHKNDYYKKIVDFINGEVQISIDGTTKSVYENIRKGARFKRVVENCKLINEYCDKFGTDKTRMWALLQKDNFKELHKFPTFAKKLGFKRLTISLDVSAWGSKEWDKKNKIKRISNAVTQSDIDSLLDQAAQENINLSFWDITTKYSKDNICPWPFERSFISSDKKVVPCCMIGNPDIFCLGKLGDLKSIWNSKQYKDFRKKHLDMNIPGACKFCYVKSRKEVKK